MAVDWGQVFKGPTGAAIIGTGGQLAGAALAGPAAQKQSEANQKFQRETAARNRQNELFDTQLGQENKDFSSYMADTRSLDSQTLGAMGNSPLQFQADRMRMNAIADALQMGGPSNLTAHLAPFARGMDMSKFRPSAAAEEPYWNAVAQASGGRFGGANLGSIYGGPGGAAADKQIGATTAGAGAERQNEWATHTAATQETLRQAGIANDAELQAAKEEAAKKPGGSLWKTLAKVGIIVGGGVATAMTGGLAAPILIGAATGAGTGAIDGGAKGALMGGALGGAMGGLGGIGGAAKGAAGAAKSSFGQALKQTVSNPGTLLRMGGAATPGAAGALMTTAGGLIQPHVSGRWGSPPPGGPAPITPENLATPTKTGMSTAELYGGSPNMIGPNIIPSMAQSAAPPSPQTTALKKAISGSGKAASSPRSPSMSLPFEPNVSSFSAKTPSATPPVSPNAALLRPVATGPSWYDQAFGPQQNMMSPYYSWRGGGR
jgi:hypothetical protein